MEIRVVESKAIVLDSGEITKLLQILKYARHRIVEHGRTQAGEKKFVDYMIVNLENCHGPHI